MRPPPGCCGFHLYLISDLYSRYGVHWQMHEEESGEQAAQLTEQAMWRQRCHDQPPILHSDNCHTGESRSGL